MFNRSRKVLRHDIELPYLTFLAPCLLEPGYGVSFRGKRGFASAHKRVSSLGILEEERGRPSALKTGAQRDPERNVTSCPFPQGERRRLETTIPSKSEEIRGVTFTSSRISRHIEGEEACLLPATGPEDPRPLLSERRTGDRKAYRMRGVGSNASRNYALPESTSRSLAIPKPIRQRSQRHSLRKQAPSHVSATKERIPPGNLDPGSSSYLEFDSTSSITWAENIRRWRHRFPELFVNLETSLASKSEQLDAPPINVFTDEEKNAIDQFVFGQSKEPLCEPWETASAETKYGNWAIVLLWCLGNAPERSLYILRSMQSMPNEVVSDVVAYLTQSWLHGPVVPDLARKEQLLELLMSFAQQPPSRHADFDTLSRPLLIDRLSVNTLKGLLEYANLAEASGLWHLNQISARHMPPNKLFRYMDTFCKLGDFDTAYQILEIAVDRGIDLNKGGKGVPTTALRLAYKLSGKPNLDHKFLALMLKGGLRMNVFNTSALICNCLDRGQVEEARALATQLWQEDTKGDYATLTIFWHDASKRDDFVGAIRFVVDNIDKFDGWQQHTRVMTHILHTLRRVHMETTPYSERSSIFNKLLAVYCRAYSVEPLMDMGILPTTWINPEGITRERRPKISALHIMISTYLSFCDDPKALVDVYDRYWHHVRTGHSIIAPLSTKTHTANSFIRAMATYPGLLRWCVTITQHMLQPLPRPDDGSTPRRSYDHAKPDVQTWTILLLAFLYNEQYVAAEKTRQMMTERGMIPNLATWNTLLSGYARKQDIPRVVGALKQLGKAGYQPDEYTLAALARVNDRHSLSEAFERQDETEEEGKISGPNTPTKSWGVYGESANEDTQWTGLAREGKDVLKQPYKDLDAKVYEGDNLDDEEVVGIEGLQP